MDSYPCLLSFIAICGLFSQVSAADPIPCPVSSPCTCSGIQIDCDNVSLTEVPKFQRVNVTFIGWEINLSKNNISEIPSKAFENITVYTINVSHNRLTRIADDAFYGSENTMNMIFLQYNKLDNLPISIGKFTKLISLSIHHNPLTSLSDDVMKSLTKLQFLDVGSVEMAEWPRGIRYLKELIYLTFYDLPLLDLESNAFIGLEGANFYLEFDNCNLMRIPKALQVLKNMTGLVIRNGTGISTSSMNKDTFKGLMSLQTLSLDNCSLTEVPDISELHSLSELELTNCPISVWPQGSVPRHSSVKRITLDNTEFGSIPSVISKLKHVTIVSFYQTKITQIGKELAGLVNLTGITFSNSPVQTVSPDAFQDIRNITFLKLDNMKLTSFPKAIRSIKHMRYADLSNNRIDCSCSAMGFMKGWHGIGKFYIEGECHNIKMQINDFLIKEVNKC